jgi:hypothetical protein
MHHTKREDEHVQDHEYENESVVCQSGLVIRVL